MPRIKNYYNPSQIELEMNLLKNKIFYFETDSEDYLKWVPCELKLVVENEIYTFPEAPILSVEGIKNLLSKVSHIIEEKKCVDKMEILDIFEKQNQYSIYEYCATEGEFSISFQNLSDPFDEEIVLIHLWISMACCGGNYFAYSKGFRFSVRFDELVDFFKTISLQLYNMTDGHEQVAI